MTSDDLASQLHQLQNLRSLGVIGDDAYESALNTLRTRHGDAVVDALLGHNLPNQAARDHAQTIGGNARVGVAVAGDLQGNVYLDGRRADQAVQLLAEYLSRLRGRCAVMPLEGMRQQKQVSDVLAISLDQVYTQLTVPGRAQREVFAGAALRALDIEDFLKQHTGENLLPWQRRTFLRRSLTAAERKKTRRSTRASEVAERRVSDYSIGQTTVHEEPVDQLDLDAFRRAMRAVDETAFFGPRLVTDTIADTSRLVLLGEPGSGKSTVLRYLALALAEAGLDESVDLPARLAGWERLGEQQRLLPIFLPLLPFSQRLAKDRPRLASANDLWSYIADQLEGGDTRTGLAEAVHAELAAGRVLLMLDGLDEGPARSRASRSCARSRGSPASTRSAAWS